MSKFDPSKLAKLKKVDRLFKSIYLFPRNKKKLQQIKEGSVNEILIIATMMIGDTIMSIPALQVLKKNYPNARITLICESVVKVILADQDLVDRFFVIKTPWLHNQKSLHGLFDVISAIRQANFTKYDLAIDFRGDWRNIFLMNFIKAIRKLSFNHSGGEYMLTDIIPANNKIVHYIDEWLYLLKAIGCEVKEDDKYPTLSVNEAGKLFLSNFIKKHKLQGKFVICVHPGASSESRKWDEERYAQVVQKINNTYKECVFILFEGPNERDTIVKIKDFLHEANVSPIIVNESLKNYLILMNCCDLIICNDSGAAHIAGALGKPSVILFGKADPEMVKPYNKNDVRIISHRNKKCFSDQIMDNKTYLDSITVDEVYDAVTELISNLKTIKGL